MTGSVQQAFSKSTSKLLSPSALACQAALIAMLLLALFGPAMQLYGSGEATRFSAYRQYGYVAVIAVVLIGSRAWRRVGRTARAPWWIIVPLAWCWLSVVWSNEPAISVSKITLVTIVFTAMFLIVDTIGFKRSSMIVAVTLCAFTVLNLYYIFFVPEIGVFAFDRDGQFGLWRGVMGDKNLLGSLCGVTVIFLIRAKVLPLIGRAMFLLPAVTLLIFSHSRTAMLMTVLALVLSAVALKLAHGRGEPSERVRHVVDRVAYAAMGLVALIFAYIAADVTSAMAVIEEPTGGANRFQIWQSMLHSYAQNPFTGSGFGAYWAKVDQNLTSYGGQSWLMMVTQGHNGYLDAAVQVGLPGLLLILLGVLVQPSRTLIRVFHRDPARFALVLALLLFVLGSNMTETSIFERDTLGNVVLAFALAIVWTGKDKRVASGRVRRGKRAARRGTSVPEEPTIASG